MKWLESLGKVLKNFARNVLYRSDKKIGIEVLASEAYTHSLFEHLSWGGVQYNKVYGERVYPSAKTILPELRGESQSVQREIIKKAYKGVVEDNIIPAFKNHGNQIARDTINKLGSRTIRKIQDLRLVYGDDRGAIMNAVTDEKYTESRRKLIVQNNQTTLRSHATLSIAQENPKTVGGLKFITHNDDKTRTNHFAAHGTIARTGHYIWFKIKPPLGHNCRCKVVIVLAKDFKEYFPPSLNSAGPDPGFFIN